MIDLLGRPLHPVREKCQNVIGIIRVHLAHMLQPWLVIAAIARDATRRSVQIENRAARPLDPAAL